ncbi:MAG TPA: VOC family protein [Herpetosiphonaceae bacterium]|nr:VOC family protein [Herpetosiphonaceae bacterium]
MQKITPFLTFNNQAGEAVEFYVSIFKNSSIHSLLRHGGDGPVMHASFQLNGQEFMAIDGGPSFAFDQGHSLFVACETQQEVDELWEKLTADGGEPGPCGWLKDKFGVSWQIIPNALGELMQSGDAGKSQKVMAAMLTMGKIDIAALRQAFEQG